MTAGATSAGMGSSSAMVMSGCTMIPPLKAAIGPCISSGCTSMRMPRGGRPLVIANSTPRWWSCSIASIARVVTTFALVTRVPSTSAKTAAIGWGGGSGASVMCSPTLLLPNPGAVSGSPRATPEHDPFGPA